ncbi:hypothetical protein QPL79_06685 [Ignisphaera sp. 4213-co]|uniref:Uncharacterized protein n=1 Tax=Ignisphaera cupida TaxID=3050454 RepID=A0ABD4Z6U5_9CREN|nr:hypothetical protein [Ignisphaera sp. 4213-co]MDK6029046.1 hypothetical protein [Ignisphaera sp. 4213-co]
MYFAFIHLNSCESLCNVLSELHGHEEFKCITTKYCSLPLQSLIIAFEKSLSAFKNKENIAKKQDLELLIRLFGMRQIKKLLKLINEEICVSQNYYVTLLYINNSLKDEEIVDIGNMLVRKAKELKCKVVSIEDLAVDKNTISNKCYAVTKTLFINWSNYCNEQVLIGISGTSEVLIL